MPSRSTNGADGPEIKSVDDILAIDDHKTDLVYVEDWGTHLKVQGLTKQQQIEIRRRAVVDGEIDTEKVQMGMFKEGVLEPVFSDEQMPRLFQKSAAAVDTVLKRVLELSGMQPEALKEKEAAFPKR